MFGGHGYIKGNVVEQVYRDARIGTLYEGTTGIQALDLLGRKVILRKGKHLLNFSGEVLSYVGAVLSDPVLRPKLYTHALKLGSLVAQWNYLTARVAVGAYFDKDQISSSSFDYLMYSGYITLAYYWLKMAAVSTRKLKEGTKDEAFHKTKIQTADFYYAHLLPRTKTHAAVMVQSPKTIMDIKNENIKI